MTCPKCSGSMQMVVVGGVEVDRCTACGGMWFDLVEEKAVLRSHAAAKLDTRPPDPLEQHRPAVACPRCRSPLMRMVDPGQPHIWYESCTICYGTFFDAGEFRDLADHQLSDLFTRWRSQARP